jgi:proliferating cell nuclear antigen
MFDVKVKAEVLKEIIDVVSTLVEEAKWKIDLDSIQIRAVDPAHIAMVELNISKESFESYNVDKCELGVDIDKIKNVLKLARATDTITINHDESKNRLVLNVGNITRWMSLVDVKSLSDPKLPALTLQTKVLVNPEELKQGIRASESVSDHITLQISPEMFELSSEGESDSMNLRLPLPLLDELDCKEPVRSSYPLDYFSNMIKSITTAQKVMIYLGNDYPMRLEFDIAEGNGHVIYLLAPRVEGD